MRLMLKEGDAPGVHHYDHAGSNAAQDLNGLQFTQAAPRMLCHKVEETAVATSGNLTFRSTG